ncbi:MAG: hypothetical protein GVY25_15720 [Bacteroidetes bacterium]|jgi:hypothetical protein|nr:hypothetical protein [Bacteroidota bacterium]
MQERTVPSDAVLVMNQEFRVNRRCRLDVIVPGASLRLRHGDTEDRVVVSVSVAGCRKEDANDVLERLRLSTRQVQDRVYVQADEPSRDADYWRWLRSDDTELFLDLALPPNTDAEISAPSGEIHASGLRGDIDIIAAACPVDVVDIGGSLRITANGEPVSVKEFSGQELQVHSTAAHVFVGDVRSDAVGLRASGGRLNVRNVEGSVDIEANGSTVTLIDVTGPVRGDLHASPISLHGTLAADIDLVALGSPITMNVGVDRGAEVRLEGRPVELDRSLPFQGDLETRRAEGTINGGGPMVSLRAVPGTVRCRSAS